MTMLGTLWLATKLIGGIYLAGILHELTHAAVVRRLGGHVDDINLLDMHVDWRLPASTPSWKLRLVGVAPLAIGGVCCVALFAVTGIPGAMNEFIVWIAALWYTFGGGTEDYSIQESVGARA